MITNNTYPTRKEIYSIQTGLKLCFYDFLSGYPEPMIGMLYHYNHDRGYSLNSILATAARILHISIDSLKFQLGELYPNYREIWK